MKLAILGFLFMGASSAFANPCAEQILRVLKHDKYPQEYRACIVAQPEFAKETAALCNEKQPGVTPQFAAFIDYNDRREAKMAELVTLPIGDPRFARINGELRQLERDWLLFGYREEVAAALMNGYRAELACRRNLK